MLTRLNRVVFRENVSAEASLRHALPRLRTPSPRKETLPTSMFGLYVAKEGLACPEIPRSALDVLNEQVKWQPFTRTLKNLNIGTEEEVEGDWEMYVDWSGSSIDQEMLILQGTEHAAEEETFLENWDTVKARRKYDPPGLGELVRKRKMEKLNGGRLESELDGTITNRTKWFQRSRIEEYMKIQGLRLEISGDEPLGTLLIRISLSSTTDI